MQYIKSILLLAIFVLSAMIGILISKKYSERVKELIEMKKALSIFKTKVKFTYEPIPDILKEMSQMTEGNVREIFELASKKIKNTSAQIAWEESISEAINNFTNEDKEAIKTLAKELRKNRLRRPN